MSGQEAVGESHSSGIGTTTSASVSASLGAATEAKTATVTSTATTTATTCNKISTSTPQKRDESSTQEDQQQQMEFINRSLASEIDASDASAICCDLTINSSTSSGASPVAKRQMSSANVSRIRPQSSYSARVLIFDDSDQEAAAAAASASAAVLSATTSIGSGVELLPASPAKFGNDNSNGSSLIRNLNLTKSSSGGLSGSSSSLHSRGYTALLRKISYQQHTNSMRAVSSGKGEISLRGNVTFKSSFSFLL